MLGPWMLAHAIAIPTPAHSQLVRVSGVTRECHPVLGGLRVLLEQPANEFQLQLDSCDTATVRLGRPTRVALNVVADELASARPGRIVRSFGLEVGGRWVRSPADDLRIARLDRVIMVAVGLAGTLALLYVTWSVVAARGSLTALLTGKPVRSSPS